MDVAGFALLTGGASGIGRACALTFVRDGAAGVALLDHDEAGLLSAKAEIESISNKTDSKCRVETFSLSVTDEEAVNNVVAKVAELFGRLDYVVNAAGIAMKHPGGAAFARTEDWRRVLDVNLTGTFFVLRAATRVMLQQDPILSNIDGRSLQRGAIVNFSSIQGLVGIELSTAYTTSKHGVLGLTRTASDDYARKGVRISAICPGYTETPMTTRDPAVKEAMDARVHSAVSMQRMGTPQEIADAVIFSCGGRSPFIAGTALSVDGGYTAR